MSRQGRSGWARDSTKRRAHTIRVPATSISANRGQPLRLSSSRRASARRVDSSWPIEQKLHWPSRSWDFTGLGLSISVEVSVPSAASPSGTRTSNRLVPDARDAESRVTWSVM